MVTAECDWSKSAWTSRMSRRNCGWPQGRVCAMRQSSLVPSSPSEESVPDTVNGPLERPADTVSVRRLAQFPGEVEVASQGLDLPGHRREARRRTASDPILYGRPA